MLRGLRQRRAGFARALAAFTLLAMAVRAIVPTGYMLAQAGPHQVLTVTLCSGQGPVEATIDLGAPQKSHPGEPASGKSHEAPCAFASAAHLAAPQALQAVSAPLRVAFDGAVRIQRTPPGPSLAAPPPWSTGPPLTA